MAIAIVQSVFTPHTFSSVTSGTATATLPNPVTSGNAVLIAFAGGDSQYKKTIGAVTDDKSNTDYSTLTYDNTATDGQGWFLLTDVTNGPSTFDVPFTVALSTSNIILGVYEISGLATSPADHAGLQSSGFTTTFDLAFTAAAANEMGFAILSNANGSGQTAVTMTNGWTLDETDLTGTTFFSAIGHNPLPTAGSNSIQGSTTAADEWNVSIVTLEAATGTPGVTLDGAASGTTSAAGNLTDQRPTTVFNPINLGTVPGDGTGDPVKVGFIKNKADLGNLVAGLTRRSTTTGVYGVTSPAGTTTVLNDTSQDWAVGQFAGQTLSILTGPLAGFVAPIASNTATAITVSSAFGSAIGAGVGYQISETPADNADGYATQAGGTAPATLTDANKTWTTNQWQGFTAHFLSGAYAGQRLQIASNTPNTLRFVESLNPGIAAGTSYAIGSVVPNLDPEFGLRSIQGPPASNLLATPGFYSLEQTSGTTYTLFAATNASTAVSTVGARVRVVNVGTASAVIAPSSNAAGQFINNDSTLTNNHVTLAAISGGVAQYAEFQCMLSNSGVTYWAVVTTGTIS